MVINNGLNDFLLINGIDYERGINFADSKENAHFDMVYRKWIHMHDDINHITDDEIISMVVLKDVLYVATKSGVYAKDGNGIFHRLKIETNG